MQHLDKSNIWGPVGSFALDPSFWDSFFRTYSTVSFFGRSFYLSQISWKKSNHKASITLGNRGISCFKSISLVLNLFQEMPRFEILWNWALILNLKPDTQFLMPSQIESPRLKKFDVTYFGSLFISSFTFLWDSLFWEGINFFLFF